MKQMVVLIGNYGSGKTEIALNLAVNAAGTSSGWLYTLATYASLTPGSAATVARSA